MLINADDGDAGSEEEKHEKSNSSGTLKQRELILCNNLLTAIQRMTNAGFWYVIPYHILDTPHHGWTSNDLAFIISSYQLGVLISSQSQSLVGIFISNDTLSLFIAHLIQILCGIIGWIAVSALHTFNYPVFIFGAFLLGFNTNCTINQSYTKLISNEDTKIAFNIMKGIGNLFIICNIIYAVSLPPIYDAFDYKIYCIIPLTFQCIGLEILIYEWCKIKNMYQAMEANHGYKAIKDDHNNEQDAMANIERVSISSFKVISPLLFLSIFISFIAAFSYTAYWCSYPIIFSDEWGISSSVGGILIAFGNIFSICLLNSMLRGSQHLILFKYPFNIILPMCLFVIGNLMFVIVYKPFIAYSSHIFTLSVIRAAFGAEMIARIYLCGPYAFNKVTQMIGFVQAIGYLMASSLIPFLFNIHHKLPFALLSLINIFLVFFTLIVFYRRKAYLSIFCEHVKIENYLESEVAFYQKIEKSKERRNDLMIDQTSIMFAPQRMRKSNLVRDTLCAITNSMRAEEKWDNVEYEKSIVSLVEHSISLTMQP